MKKIVVPTPDQPVCDFCSAPEVKWRYPAIDTTPIATVTDDAILFIDSKGDWAACDICHELIQAHDRRGLAERSIETLIRQHPELEHETASIERLTDLIHDGFWSARLGPPIRERKQ